MKEIYKVARDNSVDIKENDLDLSDKAVKELKDKYREAVDKRRNWIEFQNKRLSRNFVTYILNYYAEP